MLDRMRVVTRPLYRQVRDDVLARISAGEWKLGQALPNELDLAQSLKVSIGTLRKALQCLEAEHVITRHQGRGTFVNDQGAAEHAQRFSCIRDAAGLPIVDDVEVVATSEGAADDTEIQRLKIESGAQILRIERLRSIRGQPYMIERVALPQRRFPGLGGSAAVPNHVSALAQKHGLVVTSAMEEVSVVAATEATAARLGVPEGTPLLKLDRIAVATGGRPVEWRTGFCVPGCVHYQVKMQ
jgi:GntR family transcriptional regulator